MNYAELTQAIQDYLSEDEPSFVSNIPMFVRLCEERIYRAVQTQLQEKIGSGNFTSGVSTISTPGDFVSPLHLLVTSGTQTYFLKPKDSSWMQAAYPTTTATGRPRYYALQDHDTIVVGPTPDSAYAYSIRYIYKPDSIVTSSTSWLGANAENALFWGSVVEGYKYLKGDKDLMDVYEASFQEAVQRLKVLVEGQNRKDFYKSAEPAISSV